MNKAFSSCILRERERAHKYQQQRPEDHQTLKSPGAGVAYSCELPNIGVDNQKPGLLEEQYALLTTKPFLQSYIAFLQLCDKVIYFVIYICIYVCIHMYDIYIIYYIYIVCVLMCSCLWSTNIMSSVFIDLHLVY